MKGQSLKESAMKIAWSLTVASKLAQVWNKAAGQYELWMYKQKARLCWGGRISPSLKSSGKATPGMLHSAIQLWEFQKEKKEKKKPQNQKEIKYLGF